MTEKVTDLRDRQLQVMIAKLEEAEEKLKVLTKRIRDDNKTLVKILNKRDV